MARSLCEAILLTFSFRIFPVHVCVCVASNTGKQHKVYADHRSCSVCAACLYPLMGKAFSTSFSCKLVLPESCTWG